MKITKDFEKLTRISNGDYMLEGDLICEDSLEIELDDRLVVRGMVVAKKEIRVVRTLIAGLGIEAGEGIEAGWGIKAGLGIEAGEGIEAGWGIKAGLGIEAGWGIKAGWGIEAKTFISSKKRIFAGISLYRTTKSCNKKIECDELREGEICYGDLIITKAEEKK
jgi:hypothetical protein